MRSDGYFAAGGVEHPGPRRLRPARGRHGRRLLRHPVAEDRDPAGAALRRACRATSPRTATACATVSRVGFDLSEPAEVSFSVIDSEGTEVRRLVDDRELAGYPQAPLPLERPRRRRQRRSRRDVPAAGRQTQGGAGGRLDQGGAGGHQAAQGQHRLGRAERDRARRVARGAHPLPRPAQQGAGVPGLPHRRRRARAGEAVPLGREPRRCLGRHGARRRAGPGGLVLVQREGARPGRQQDRGARAGPRGAGRAAAHRRGGARAHAPGPARRGARRARWSLCGSARASAASASRSRGSGSRRTIRKDRRRGGRLRVRIPSDARTGVYLVRVTIAGGRRAVWPLAVAGQPPRGTRAAARARSSCCRRSPGRAPTSSTRTSTASPTPSTR